MTHNLTGRQKSPHLRLSPPEVKGLWELGQYTPKGYLYHLILAHRKPGWIWRIDNVSEFCREWGFARRTFYRAKAALIEEGLIEEEIFGAIELKATSTDVCVTSDTGVSDEAFTVPNVSHSVPDLAQPVPNGSHLSAETFSEQESCDSTSLKQLITPTTQDVCVSADVITNKNPEIRTDVGVFNRQLAHVENAGYPNQAISPEQAIYTPPVLLQVKKKFKINLADPHLRRAIERWPERIDVAISCLEEKEATVKHPTRFLQKAIEEKWQPEALAKEKAPDDFQVWFQEARKRGLVIGSQCIDNVLVVYTVDEQCIPFEQLRQQSWEQLEAQLQTVTDDDTSWNPSPPEQIPVLLPESELSGDAIDNMRQAG
ncbi:MAG: hypothetical protein F6K31_18700 [Symploca sp. SIO2G7]|nr:hypothetical protein [Symploca sp. SIO2G7]